MMGDDDYDDTSHAVKEQNLLTREVSSIE